MIHLTYADLLHIGQRTLGAGTPIRAQGPLESALARPRAGVFGEDADESLNEKAAALTHSLARNHGVVDDAATSRGERASLAPGLLSAHTHQPRSARWRPSFAQAWHTRATRREACAA